jgi:hypothetical protein
MGFVFLSVQRPYCSCSKQSLVCLAFKFRKVVNRPHVEYAGVSHGHTSGSGRKVVRPYGLGGCFRANRSARSRGAIRASPVSSLALAVESTAPRYTSCSLYEQYRRLLMLDDIARQVTENAKLRCYVGMLSGRVYINHADSGSSIIFARC